jgi:tubulin polyglutamylase TTLL4
LIASHASSIPAAAGVVPGYVDWPLLLTERKFDIRLYALVTSVQPLRVWMHESGLARFATHPYAGAELSDLRAHLTNICVNQGDEAFLSPADVECIENSTWSLAFLMDDLTAREFNVEVLRSEIDRVATTAIIAGCCVVRNHHSRFVRSPRTSFELFGIDLIIDQDLRPHVLEVNISPAMSGLGSALDLNIKWRLMLDTLRIARIIECDCRMTDPCPGLRKIERCCEDALAPQRIAGVESGAVMPWSEPTFADVMLIRDLVEENARKGGFRRLFPVKETLPLFRPCFDRVMYRDRVTWQWIEMEPFEQTASLKCAWAEFSAQMNRVTR